MGPCVRWGSRAEHAEVWPDLGTQQPGGPPFCRVKGCTLSPWSRGHRPGPRAAKALGGTDATGRDVPVAG